jgi:hypothetical protein
MKALETNNAIRPLYLKSFRLWFSAYWQLPILKRERKRERERGREREREKNGIVIQEQHCMPFEE